MNTGKGFKLVKDPVVTGLSIFVVVLLLTQSVTYQHYLLFRSARDREVNSAVNLAREKLQTALTNSLSATQTLSFVIKKYGVPSDFDSIAEHILQANRFIDALELEEGGTITHVYPKKGNESVIGYNVLADSFARIEANKAIEKKQLFFAGPFKLKQGGFGIVGRLPIFIDGHFWGFSVALIKLSTFLQMAQIDSASDGPYAYQLVKVNPRTGKEEFFLPDPELFKGETATSVYVPDGEWRIYARPKKSEALISLIPLSLLGFLLAVMGGVFSYYITRQPYALKKLVDEKSRQLKNTEENYRVTLERVSDAFVALDTDWRFTYMNQQAGELFNCSPESVIGKSIWAEFPEFVNTPFYMAYHIAMSAQKYIYLEEYYGPYNLWFENNIYPSVDGLSVFFKDISERKRTEVALKQSEQRYRTLVQEMPEAVYTCDAEGYIVLYNKAAALLWGREPEIGKEKWGGAAKLYDRNGTWVKHEQTPMAIALREGQTTAGEEVIIERPDGVKRFVLAHPTILFNADKTVAGAINILVDITDRKRAEQEVEQERTYSDSIINSLPGVFYLYNTDGKFLRWNRNMEIVTGYTGEEISRMHPLDFFEGEEKEILKERIQSVFITGAAEVESNFVTKSGQKIPYYFNGFSGKFQDIDCLIGMGIDISARKKAEEEIAKSERRFRSVLDRMLEGIQIFDADWRCIYTNDAAVMQGPYKKEEVMGFTLMEKYPGIEETELFKTFVQCRNDRLSKHIEYEFSFPDGTAKWFELSIQPNSRGLFVLSVDITERKIAAEAIMAKEEKYRYLFNNNPALIFIWDLENLRIVEANETALQEYGYTAEEILCLTVLDLRMEEEHENIKAFAKTMITQPAGRAKRVWRHLNRKGELMYMDISSHRITYNGRPAILSVAENITQKLLIEDKLKKSYDDIRLLNEHLETIREEERAGIAREIHDELGQQLTALKMDASWINKKLSAADQATSERLISMISLIDGTVKTVRRIASDLRPGILDDLGLVAALEWQSNEFEKRTAIKVVFNAEVNEVDLPQKCSIAVFRIYQEVLTNVARHAHATVVETSVTMQDKLFSLTVKDDGKGFDVDAVKTKNTLGLIGINERVSMLNGEMILDSNLERGTMITIRIPCK